MNLKIDIPVHPAAELFPLMSEDELKALAEDMGSNGQRLPCLKWKGKLLDGRNRYIAARLAGIKPKFENYTGDDPVGLIISLNVPRRHLTPSQRALLATDLSSLRKGDNQHSTEDAQHCATSKTQTEAAEQLGVSRRSVQSAAAVKREAEPEIVEAVRHGDLTVHTAQQLSKVATPSEQKRVAGAEDPETAAKKIIEKKKPTDPKDFDPSDDDSPPPASRQSAAPTSPPVDAIAKPWSGFEEQVRVITSDLRSASRRLNDILKPDADSKRFTQKFAHFYSHAGTIGAINAVIRTLENNLPGEESKRDPGFITVQQAAGRKSLGGKAAA
jgi:hypothetical protein